MKKHALALLSVVNALLILGLVALWFQPDGNLRNTHWRAPDPVKTDYLALVPSLPARKSVDTGRLMAMLERPLFSSTRRPPPRGASEAQASGDSLGAARLLGVFEGGQASGVILHVAGKNRRLRLNESVDGWVLQGVQKRAATFVSGDQTRTLSMVRANMGAEVTTTATMPVAPGYSPPQAPTLAKEAIPASTPAPPPTTRRFGP